MKLFLTTPAYFLAIYLIFQLLKFMYSTGSPNKHGKSVTNSKSSLLWISILIPNFKSYDIITSARVYIMKTVNGCKYVSNVSARWTVKTDKFTLFVYCNFLALLSTTICSQTINKQFVNIADESLTDYSFLSWYHYTKTKNYLKRRYRIRHWILYVYWVNLYRASHINFKVNKY